MLWPGNRYAPAENLGGAWRGREAGQGRPAAAKPREPHEALH